MNALARSWRWSLAAVVLLALWTPAFPAATDHTGLVPLDQMADKAAYKGEDGGLYGGGKNVPPAQHQNAAGQELARIVALGPDGRPAPDGKVVLISIGMSNTTQEFSRFKEQADRDAEKPGREPSLPWLARACPWCPAARKGTFCFSCRAAAPRRQPA